MTDVLIVSTALEDSVSVVLSETTASGALLFVTVTSEVVLFVTMTFRVVLLSTTVLGAKVSDTFLTFERRGYFPW